MSTNLLYHTPAELQKGYRQYAHAIQDFPGFTFGLETLDEYVTPFAPGTISGFIGRPGDAKTSLMLSLARMQAKRCKEDEVVVYVSWEESAEEIMAMLYSGAEYNRWLTC